MSSNLCPTCHRPIDEHSLTQAYNCLDIQASLHAPECFGELMKKEKLAKGIHG